MGDTRRMHFGPFWDCPSSKSKTRKRKRIHWSFSWSTQNCTNFDRTCPCPVIITTKHFLCCKRESSQGSGPKNRYCVFQTHTHKNWRYFKVRQNFAREMKQILIQNFMKTNSPKNTTEMQCKTEKKQGGIQSREQYGWSWTRHAHAEAHLKEWSVQFGVFSMFFWHTRDWNASVWTAQKHRAIGSRFANHAMITF